MRSDDVDIVDVEVRYHRFIKTVITMMRSFNPFFYKSLSRKRLSDAMTYFFEVLIICFILLVIVSIPVFLALPGNLSTELSKLDNFTIDPSLEMDETIEFNRFDITITDTKDYEEEFVLITNESVYMKSLMCQLVKPTCLLTGETKVINSENASELLDHKEGLGKLISFILLLMIPGILVLLFVYYLISYILIILITTSIIYLICKLTKHRMHWRKLLIIGIYACPVMLLLDIVPLLYFSLSILPFIFYIAIFGTAVFLIIHSKKKKW